MRATDGVPYLLVTPPGEIPLEMIDLSGLDDDLREAAAVRTLQKGTDTPFDLSTGPLHRNTLIKLGPTEHILSRVYHHIITDGWSAGLMNAELSATYTTILAGGTPSTEPPAMRYSDFALRQKELLASGELEEQLAYWQKRLANLPALDLPADRTRPAEQTFAGATVIRDLPDHVLPAARKLAKDQGV